MSHEQSQLTIRLNGRMRTEPVDCRMLLVEALETGSASLARRWDAPRAIAELAR